MRKLFLHIGTEKTGTTSIQELLYRNRDYLAGHGFHFLQSAGERNNRALPACCIDDDKADDFLRENQVDGAAQRKAFRQNQLAKLEQEISDLGTGIDSVIVSSEHFHSRTNTPAEVERVRQMFAPYFDQVTVICYVREQAATCASFYSEAIKAGFTTPFDKFSRACRPENRYYNLRDMLANWAEVFGQENLLVRVFDRSEMIGGDLYDDFMAQLGQHLGAGLNREIEVENESLSTLGQLVGRAINTAIPGGVKNQLMNSRRRSLMKQVSNHFKGKGIAMSAERASAIFETFRPSNRAVSQQYLGRDRDLFRFAEPRQSNLALDDTFVDGLADILGALVDDRLDLPDRYADLFRDAALNMETGNPEGAYLLMELASRIRPDGVAITHKLEEYRRKTGRA